MAHVQQLCFPLYEYGHFRVKTDLAEGQACMSSAALDKRLSPMRSPRRVDTHKSAYGK